MLESRLGSSIALGCSTAWAGRDAMLARGMKKILLPSARHLEEGRGTTILELPRLENCISRLCSRPLGCHPPPPNNTQIG